MDNNIDYVDEDAVIVSEIYPEMKALLNAAVVFSPHVWDAVCGEDEAAHVRNVCTCSLTSRITDCSNYMHKFSCWLPDESGALAPIILKVIYDELESGEPYVGIMTEHEKSIF